MAGFSKGLHSRKFASVADGLVVALAVSLPWSTSATSILAVFWLLALIPTLRWADIVAKSRRSPAACLFARRARRRRECCGRMSRCSSAGKVSTHFKIAGYTAVVRSVPPIWKQRMGVRGLSGFVRRIAGRDGHSHGDTVGTYADSRTRWQCVGKKCPTQAGEFVTCIFGA